VILIVVLASAAFAQQREQYPGQGEHSEPPKNFYCSNHPLTPAKHKCACEPSCVKNENGEMEMHPDPKCTVYCWEKDHCACGHQCESTN